LTSFLFPALLISGLVYPGYGLWQSWPLINSTLEWIALIHTSAAFVMAAFIIIHIYLLTTGHPFVAHVKPIVTGYGKVDLDPDEEACLCKDEP